MAKRQLGDVLPRVALSLAAVASAAACAGAAHTAASPPAQVIQAAPGEPLNLRRTVTVSVVEKVKSAVVYISTEKIVAESVSPFGNDPVFGNFGRQTVLVPRESLGSGFVVHESGYVVTNNHVVDRARKIKVQLADGRTFNAEVISSDPDADLAILKVDSKDPLPTLHLGDSSDLMIGEPVIAVGNPLGYSYSVSTGIVSAIHREIKPDPNKAALSDLIQTDAAINPGNSGGPLLNAYGQVIGINTAIRGDAQNIGFAIQVNRFRDLVPALMDPGKARKLEIPLDFTERRTVHPPATVTTLVEIATPRGTSVVESVNGRKPRDIIDAYATVLGSGKAEIVVVTTDGQTIKVNPREIPVPDAIAQARKRLGITVEPVTPALAEKYGLRIEDGMVVTEVVKRSIAEKAQLLPGDVIFQLGRFRVRTLDEFGQLMSQLPPKGNVRIGVLRGDSVGYGVLQL